MELNIEPAELLHCAVVTSSEENADMVFRRLFGMSVVKEFMVGEELGRALFGFGGEAKVIVYSAGGATIEAFVSPERSGARDRYDHICLAARNRRELLERATRMGMEVTSFARENGDVFFIRDTDGNFYEIKEKE
jgi:hypothetical protein